MRAKEMPVEEISDLPRNQIIKDYLLLVVFFCFSGFHESACISPREESFISFYLNISWNLSVSI